MIFLASALPVQAATLHVPAGGDLQAALINAQPGDVLSLQAGATFTGNFVLPPKPAGAIITIRSSATLPNRRMTAGDFALTPLLQPATVEPAVACTNSSNWTFDGIRFGSNPGGIYDVVGLDGCTNITFDRVIIIGGPQGQKRGIRANGRNITLTRSHIANIWAPGQDSQAFCAWNGAGPFTLVDNYLEAAGENVMFGGANSSSPANVPADILVENNHFNKRPEWRGDHPSSVKNLFELKSAKRAIIRNNLFEQNWTDAQNGYAILFTVRNDDGGAPWSVVEDVLFERNVVRDVENGFNVLGYDSYQPSGRTTRVTIRNNLIVTAGTFLQAGGEVGTLTVDHNTVDQGYTFMMLYSGAVWVAGTSAVRLAQFAVENLTVTNMLANHNDYGLIGEDAGMGTPGLIRQARSYTWTNNVLAGGNTGIPYPPSTWRPTMAEYLAQFSSGYNLKATSTYVSSGTNGSALGSQSGLEPRAPANLRMTASH